MKIWFDADNAPHVLVMKPLAEELTRRGHIVAFTARDRADTCQLLDMYGLSCTRVGGAYGRSSLAKAMGTVGRALQLAKRMRKWRADISFGHGSRSLPIASRLLGIPSITMYDYEWVNPAIFNGFCTRILLPEAITVERCAEAGIDSGKVAFYPGFKENLYLSDIEPDPAIAAELGLTDGKIRVLLRPPATTAHYHNPESEEILKALLAMLLENKDVELVWVPRTPELNALVEGRHAARVIVPRRVYPGPQLILAMSMVVGGGGTMTREAAILGVPSCSFFRGRPGKVDERLVEMGALKTLSSIHDLPSLPSPGSGRRCPIPPPPGMVGRICSLLTEGVC